MIRLMRFLKPYRFFVLIVLIMVFIQSLSQLYLPTLMADIVDIGIVNGDIPYILRVGGIMLLVAALSVVCSIAASFFSAKSAIGFSKILREKIFSQVEKFSLQEFNEIGTSSLITRTTNDITQIERVLLVIMRMMVRAPLMAVGGIILAISKNAALSLIFLFVLPFLGILIFLIARKGMPLFKTLQLKLDDLNRVLREGLTGIRVIRAFNRIDHEKKRFESANRDLTDTAVKVNKIMALMMPIMMLVMNFTIIAIIWFGSIQIDQANMQVGDMMAFIQYATQIMFSLIMLSMMFVMLPRAQVSAVRVNEVLELDPQIKNPVNTAVSGEKAGRTEFRDVTFSYPGAEKPVLEHISFTANPGEVTAIIGSTGSGKSTLVSLIPRFYDIDSGQILIDGIDITSMTQEYLRSKIGFVPQKAFLFSGTIKENIKYGKEDAGDEEIRQAAEAAQVMDFIAEHEDGFEALIEQGGANVSGGQKQRLAIARAFVRKPEIYIFDDSFSALDYKTTAKLRAALKKETTDAVVLLVAQRVSTVINADKIIVLENGRISGIGTHKKLLETCEVYKEIVASQLSAEEIA